MTPKLSPESSTFRSPGMRLRMKGVVLAIAFSMLPVLSVGTAIYFFGDRAITEQALQVEQVGVLGPAEAQLFREKQRRLLGLLLLGTGVTALSAGALAACLASHLLPVRANVSSKQRFESDELRTDNVESDLNPVQQSMPLTVDAPPSLERSLAEAKPSVVLTGGIRRILEISDLARDLAIKIEKASLQVHPSSERREEEAYASAHHENDLTEIQHHFTEATLNVKDVSEKAHQVSEIVGFIDNLAIQVNQVAINATIKSGRDKALDQGTLLTTTETVRTLTHSIGQKTTEIAPLISKIQADVKAVSTGIEQGAEKVAAKVELPQDTWRRV